MMGQERGFDLSSEDGINEWKVNDNLLVWMIQVNGFVIDARHAPREIQEEAFRKGLIPYIPAE
jgi:hypothetical protein